MDAITAVAAKSRQSCLTLCNPIDGSPPGSSVLGILQARILEWVAISFSNAQKWKLKVKSLSHVQLFATPWTVAHQAPPSMGFPRQEYQSGLPLPSLMLLLRTPKFCYIRWGTFKVLIKIVIQKMFITWLTKQWTNKSSRDWNKWMMQRLGRATAQIFTITCLQCLFQPPEGRNSMLFFDLLIPNIMPKGSSRNKIKILHKWRGRERKICLRGKGLNLILKPPKASWSVSCTRIQDFIY